MQPKTCGQSMKDWEALTDYSSWLKRFKLAIKQHDEPKVRRLILEAFDNDYDIPQNFITGWVLDLVKHLY